MRRAGAAVALRLHRHETFSSHRNALSSPLSQVVPELKSNPAAIGQQIAISGRVVDEPPAPAESSKTVLDPIGLSHRRHAIDAIEVNRREAEDQKLGVK